MIEIKQKSACTGCAACRSVCPVGAIRMDPDREGFLYPQVDPGICVKCGRCVQVCPKKKTGQLQRISQAPREKERPGTVVREQNERAYAAYNKEAKERAMSSSGGIFYTLAQAVLKAGGVVYGARFDDEFRVRHGKAESEDELIPLIGSKYVQSEIGDCFRDVKKNLEAGKKVLFAGTMCQVEGLLASLPVSLCQKLYCVDLICMGVPSPYVWRSYFNILSRAGTIQHINFKSKIKGWQRFHLHIRYEAKDVYKEGMCNPYMQTFFRGYNMRPSCFHCEYKGQPRKSDITLADCWGIERMAADMNDNRGCSTVIIHTEKGQELFDRVRAGLEARELSLESAIVCNQNYCKCHKEPALRNLFWQAYKVCPHIAVFVFGNAVWISGKQLLRRVIQTARPKERKQQK